MKPLNEIIEWAFNRHRATNHYYDKYLPYEFHLNLVNTQVDEYADLCDVPLSVAKAAGAGHDLIEDTRTTYNDILEFTQSRDVTEIIYAVSNEKGRNRAARADDRYYKGIRETPGATFIKLCDRLANIKYGILTRSRMPAMYLKENADFKSKLYDPRFDRMFRDMDAILDDYSKNQ